MPSPTYTLSIDFDRENGEILFHVLDDSTGAEPASPPMVQPRICIKLADLKGSDGLYHPVQFRELCVFNADGSQAGTIMALCSEVYQVAPS